MLSEYSLEMKRNITNMQRKRAGRREIGKNASNAWAKGSEKLICTLDAKKKYVLDYRTLQMYMSLGMIVSKVYRVLAFKQSPWMKSFIDKNID
jgi:hypothetical protein